MGGGGGEDGVRNSFSNTTLAGFAPATATWYGPPNGHGTDTGACGFGNVGNPPYNSLIAAGNQALYQNGKGCGNPIKIRITDECPGACNAVPVWFDLSGIAFGALAKPGQDSALRNAGKIQISYQKNSMNQFPASSSICCPNLIVLDKPLIEEAPPGFLFSSFSTLDSACCCCCNSSFPSGVEADFWFDLRCFPRIDDFWSLLSGKDAIDL
nr:putative expansin-B14 [Ipomoea batatas]